MGRHVLLTNRVQDRHGTGSDRFAILADGSAAAIFRGPAAHACHRIDGFPHGGRPFCDPGDPSLPHPCLSRNTGCDGFAVNASTMGMAVAGLIVSVLSQHIDRRFGILISLALLSLPTALLAVAPDLTAFTVLRIAQGLCMASAFTLTLAYLGEECSAADAASAFAAYITGNVASNLIRRLISSALADHLGMAGNFYLFAALNLAGPALVSVTGARAAATQRTGSFPPYPLAVG